MRFGCLAGALAALASPRYALAGEARVETLPVLTGAPIPLAGADLTVRLVPPGEAATVSIPLPSPRFSPAAADLGAAAIPAEEAPARGQAGGSRERGEEGTSAAYGVVFDRAAAGAPAVAAPEDPAASAAYPFFPMKSRTTRAIAVLGPAAAVALAPNHGAAQEGLDAASRTWASGVDITLGLLIGAAAVIAALHLFRWFKPRLAAAFAPSSKAAPKPSPLSRKAKLLRLAAGLVLALKASPLLCPSGPGPTRPVAVAATPYQQRDIIVDGMRLRYIDEGSGPPLLLIPGLTSRVEEFDGMTGELRKDFRVLSVDLPGSGYSDKPDRPYSLDFYETTLLHFLDKLGIKSAYVAGGSLGGNLTLRLTERAPERFPRAVAWAPAASWPSKPAAAGFAHGFGGYALFWPVVRIQSGFWYSPDFPGRRAALEQTWAYYSEVMSPGFVRMYWDLVTEQIGASLQDIASGIHRPVLLVWGDQDDGAGMAAGVKRLHQLIPGSELEVLPGARHSLTAERPGELVSALRGFLPRP